MLVAPRPVLPPSIDDDLFFFRDSDVPPSLPDDPLFRIDATSWKMECPHSAHIIVNHLLQFMLGNADSPDTSVDITKISRTKFAIKANVQKEGVECSLKVRLYKTCSGFILEFQRRSGDTLTFHDIYRSALKEIQHLLLL
uniref:Uncharacterized protein n=1 Tax=viral metagenome TaxID=1070528 RepID=A0A6C0BZ27_9ZZZZ